MKKVRRLARWQLIVLVSILTLVVAGCANVRRGVSWPSLEVVTINEQTRVLVVYNQRITAIDPYQGPQVHVIRDADGEVVRAENGDVREWDVELKFGDEFTFYASPFEEDGTFYFPTYHDRIILIDSATATIEDEEGIPLSDGVIADVIVTDELIYVPYSSEDVVALNRETFEEVWRFDTAEGVWATPLLVDGVLYVTSINHTLYALDAADGTEIWAEPVDLEGAVASTPLLYNDYLYIGSYSHKMYQVSVDSGVIVNEYEGNNWVWGTPVIVDDVLYYTDLSGYVYALNADDLSEIWAERPARRGIRPAPIVTDDFVIVAARDGSVYWLNRESGTTVQQAEVDGKPELLADILYLPADEELGLPELMLVASTDNKRLVTAFDMETFSQLWVYQR